MVAMTKETVGRGCDGSALVDRPSLIRAIVTAGHFDGWWVADAGNVMLTGRSPGSN